MVRFLLGGWPMLSILVPSSSIGGDSFFSVAAAAPAINQHALVRINVQLHHDHPSIVVDSLASSSQGHNEATLSSSSPPSEEQSPSSNLRKWHETVRWTVTLDEISMVPPHTPAVPTAGTSQDDQTVLVEMEQTLSLDWSTPGTAAGSADSGAIGTVSFLLPLLEDSMTNPASSNTRTLVVALWEEEDQEDPGRIEHSSNSSKQRRRLLNRQLVQVPRTRLWYERLRQQPDASSSPMELQVSPSSIKPYTVVEMKAKSRCCETRDNTASMNLKQKDPQSLSILGLASSLISNLLTRWLELGAVALILLGVSSRKDATHRLQQQEQQHDEANRPQRSVSFVEGGASDEHELDASASEEEEFPESEEESDEEEDEHHDSDTTLQRQSPQGEEGDEEFSDETSNCSDEEYEDDQEDNDHENDGGGSQTAAAQGDPEHACWGEDTDNEDEQEQAQQPQQKPPGQPFFFMENTQLVNRWTARRRDSRDDDSESGLELPPPMERHVVRPMPGILFEDELERFKSLDLSSPLGSRKSGSSSTERRSQAPPALSLRLGSPYQALAWDRPMVFNSPVPVGRKRMSFTLFPPPAKAVGAIQMQNPVAQQISNQHERQPIVDSKKAAQDPLPPQAPTRHERKSSVESSTASKAPPRIQAPDDHAGLSRGLSTSIATAPPPPEASRQQGGQLADAVSTNKKFSRTPNALKQREVVAKSFIMKEAPVGSREDNGGNSLRREPNFISYPEKFVHSRDIDAEEHGTQRNKSSTGSLSPNRDGISKRLGLDAEAAGNANLGSSFSSLRDATKSGSVDRQDMKCGHGEVAGTPCDEHEERKSEASIQAIGETLPVENEPGALVVAGISKDIRARHLAANARPREHHSRSPSPQVSAPPSTSKKMTSDKDDRSVSKEDTANSRNEPQVSKHSTGEKESSKSEDIVNGRDASVPKNTSRLQEQNDTAEFTGGKPTPEAEDATALEQQHKFSQKEGVHGEDALASKNSCRAVDQTYSASDSEERRQPRKLSVPENDQKELPDLEETPTKDMWQEKSGRCQDGNKDDEKRQEMEEVRGRNDKDLGAEAQSCFDSKALVAGERSPANRKEYEAQFCKPKATGFGLHPDSDHISDPSKTRHVKIAETSVQPEEMLSTLVVTSADPIASRLLPGASECANQSVVEHAGSTLPIVSSVRSRDYREKEIKPSDRKELQATSQPTVYQVSNDMSKTPDQQIQQQKTAINTGQTEASTTDSSRGSGSVGMSEKGAASPYRHIQPRRLSAISAPRTRKRPRSSSENDKVHETPPPSTDELLGSNDNGSSSRAIEPPSSIKIRRTDKSAHRSQPRISVSAVLDQPIQSTDEQITPKFERSAADSQSTSRGSSSVSSITTTSTTYCKTLSPQSDATPDRSHPSAPSRAEETNRVDESNASISAELIAKDQEQGTGTLDHSPRIDPSAVVEPNVEPSPNPSYGEEQGTGTLDHSPQIEPLAVVEPKVEPPPAPTLDPSPQLEQSVSSEPKVEPPPTQRNGGEKGTETLDDSPHIEPLIGVEPKVEQGEEPLDHSPQLEPLAVVEPKVKPPPPPTGGGEQGRETMDGSPQSETLIGAEPKAEPPPIADDGELEEATLKDAGQVDEDDSVVIIESRAPGRRKRRRPRRDDASSLPSSKKVCQDSRPEIVPSTMEAAAQIVTAPVWEFGKNGERTQKDSPLERSKRTASDRKEKMDNAKSQSSKQDKPAGSFNEKLSSSRVLQGQPATPSTRATNRDNKKHFNV